MKRTWTLAVPALLTLGACTVQKDAGNDTTLISVDHNRIDNAATDVSKAADNLAADAGNAVENAGPILENTADTIATRAKRVGDKAENAVDNTKIEVTTKNTAANSSEEKR